MGIISSTGNIGPEEYEAQEVPISVIKEMIKDGTWEGSLEEEEVLYNLESDYYSPEYTEKVKEALNEM